MQAAVSLGIALGVFIFIADAASQTTANQQALHAHLFTSYEAGEKPYCGGAVNVTLDLALRQVIDLDEPHQIMKVSVWIRLSWRDCRLVWNSSEFGGIRSLVVPVRYVWVPDITLFDGVSPELAGLHEFRPTVDWDGGVSYNFPSLTQSLCPLDMGKFPYDQQTCRLSFGSWAYNGLVMDLMNKQPEGDLTSAVEHVEWTYVSLRAERRVMHYGCCPEPYPDVTFYLTLQRKPNFYLTSLFVPSALITLLAVLGYYLPVESGEKVSLQITVMLSLAVFQQLVSDKLPPFADTTPIIARYFSFSLYLVGMTCLMAVIVIATHYQGNTGMPHWLYNVGVIKLSKITFVDVENDDTLLQIRNNIGSPDKQHIKHLERSPTENYTKLLFDPGVSAPKIDYTEAWKKLATNIDRICFFVFINVYGMGLGIFLYLFNF